MALLDFLIAKRQSSRNNFLVRSIQRSQRRFKAPWQVLISDLGTIMFIPWQSEPCYAVDINVETRSGCAHGLRGQEFEHSVEGRLLCRLNVETRGGCSSLVEQVCRCVMAMCVISCRSRMWRTCMSPGHVTSQCQCARGFPYSTGVRFTLSARTHVLGVLCADKGCCCCLYTCIRVIQCWHAWWQRMMLFTLPPLLCESGLSACLCMNGRSACNDLCALLKQVPAQG